MLRWLKKQNGELVLQEYDDYSRPSGWFDVTTEVDSRDCFVQPPCGPGCARHEPPTVGGALIPYDFGSIMELGDKSFRVASVDYRSDTEVVIKLLYLGKIQKPDPRQPREYPERCDRRDPKDSRHKRVDVSPPIGTVYQSVCTVCGFMWVDKTIPRKPREWWVNQSGLAIPVLGGLSRPDGPHIWTKAREVLDDK